LEEHSTRVLQTKVGDRYALEAMNEGGHFLSGEQPGHVIMSDFATTGDGLLTGLHLAAEVASTAKTVAELASTITMYLQILVNVPGVDMTRVSTD